MKTFILIALTLSNIAFANDITLNCSNGLRETTMVLTDNHVVMDEITYTNMMDVDSSMTWRGYTKIGNPWRSITITTQLLNGVTGSAIVEVTDLDTYEYDADSYQCSL